MTPGFADNASRAGRSQSFRRECYGRMLDAKTRRDALDRAITELAGAPQHVDRHRAARLPPRRLHADPIRVDRRARRLEQVPSHLARPVPRPHPQPRELRSRRRRRQGAITKAGNSTPRRLLVEAAWHHRRPPRLGVTLERRRTKQITSRASPSRPERPPASRTLDALEGRGKPRTIVVVAVARKLAGRCLGTRDDG